MRVLLVDRAFETRELLGGMLAEAGYVVVAVATAEEALKVAREVAFEVVLTDLDLPGIGGVELCWELRSRAVGSSLFHHLIVMTEQTEIGFHIEALDGGADDFLPKPVDRALLCARLRVAARIIGQQRELLRLATIDALSGLLNRRSFFEQAEELLFRCRAKGVETMAVMADIDHFKRINDSRGHAVGDLVIQRVAAVLRENLCGHDLVGRLGGEEFGLLLTAADLRTALEQTERIRTCIVDLGLETDGVPLPVTASFGLAPVEADDRDISQALRRADAALYRAKQQGRNRVVAGVAQVA